MNSVCGIETLIAAEYASEQLDPTQESSGRIRAFGRLGEGWS